ncbi:MAG: glycogen/starch/alpha-glucan phosphorylase [Methylococcales symbiont of Hymedesmia sp. n. MRB-2018]|nr:MAG: glycogen/starch/alpha-glucan phosphorylase [Methylococcales symbiont of Hymedesmia sp. n. MRB-2018]
MPTRIFEKSKPKKDITVLPELGMDKKAFIADFKKYYSHRLGRDSECRSPHYAYEALSLAVSDRLIERWKKTHASYKAKNCKKSYYLSMEFLMGRALTNAMLNLGVTNAVEKALYDLGLEVEELIDSEPDAGLGNGGLGRLAACFIDSCATLQLPVTGYGLRYEYGMFSQAIKNGEQIENPDHWLRNGNVWEIERPEDTVRIKFAGHVERYTDDKGKEHINWINTNDILAVPYDTPIPGYQNGTVNTLRLWKSEATKEFNLQEFNAGAYAESVAEKNTAENITMVLYPNDANENGKVLRLKQQYLLASASLQDVVAGWVRANGSDFTHFAEKNCFQLNDTHPSISVAELMRLLMDEQGLDWDKAWSITGNTMAYTNHTLLPEALEKWSVDLMQYLLPRVMEIIFEINARFMAEVSKKWPGEIAYLSKMSIIEEGGDKQVRMAYLAIVGSFSVNGVAALHSQLLKDGLFNDFYQLWPEKFNNKTNGVTPRRWLAACNPGLSELITKTIGNAWITDLSQLEKLKPHAEKAAFRKKWFKLQQASKQELIEYQNKELGYDMGLSVNALFDVQVKRIHEYKRQILNVLHIIHLYNQIKQGKTKNWTTRYILIGGKAAPGYAMAKKTIKLVNNVANIINNDPDVGDKLKVLFFPNYRVSAMEKICTAADLSEQISTAGKEASGTGNMKFMMNGAVTIGTLDGANVEIREEVGDDNFFLFGLEETEVEQLRSHYNPSAMIEADDDLKAVMNLLESGYFNQLEQGVFDDIIASLKNPNDLWMTIADFRSFIDAQQRVSIAYQDKEQWTKMSILNTASSGKFSTDRTIAQYADEIWGLTAVEPAK